AQRHAKALPRQFLFGIALVSLWSSAAMPAMAQEADADGPGPISDLSIDEIAPADSANVDAGPTLPYRIGPVDPIGGVDRGEVVDEVDPYAAEGLRLGAFIVRPTLEIGLSATHSVSNTDTNGPAGVVETKSISYASTNSVGLQIDSDWSRHSLNLDLNGTLPIGISGDDDEPTADVVGTLGLDLSALTSLSLSANYGYDTENPQSAAFLDAIEAGAPLLRSINEPATQSYSGSATLNHDFGGLSAQISAAISRLEYGAAQLSDGTTISQSDLNSINYDVSLRGGYALSGVLSPFVEVGYGQRVTDDLLDSAGLNRNATNYQLRLGTEIDFGEKLSGEVAVGYGVEQYDDASLADVSGLIADIALAWSPVRGTDVTLDANTSFVPSGTEDVSGSLLYATELGLTHRLTSQLTGTASIGAAFETFEGPAADETTLNGSLGLIYNLNRYMALTGRIEHEQVFSTDESARESTSGVFVGMRLQR
ncbi:MAG: outer membrane beta-barrel protein, partial [Pseudomonadota bacterium]